MFEGKEGDKKEVNNTFVCEKVDLMEMIRAWIDIYEWMTSI